MVDYNYSRWSWPLVPYNTEGWDDKTHPTVRCFVHIREDSDRFFSGFRFFGKQTLHLNARYFDLTNYKEVLPY
jgi:hypothetical protein